MHTDALEEAGAGSVQRHLRASLLPLQDAPQRSGRAVAQHRPRPARLDRRQPASLDGRVGVPDGVDASVQAVQAGLSALDDHRLAVQPAFLQLADRQHAPLRRGTPRDLEIEALRLLCQGEVVGVVEVGDE